MNIPGFTIDSVLGEGGMATVYLAEQISLSRKVALKVMSPTLIATDSDFCERFVNEGRIVAKLRHPHIVTIHDIGCSDETYFMAMEYCPGGTLKERIADGRARTRPLRILRQIAEALGYAHAHGFIHRDVKPANVLFRDDDTVALSDFGIAKTVDANTLVTREGWAIGTPDYMSCEQSAGKPLAPTADLYSLGIVMYEMLTGRKPYQGPDALATAMQHATAPIPRLPPEYLSLQHLLDGLLAKQPAGRFASADDLLAEIDALERAQPKPVDNDATRFLGAVPQGGASGTRQLPAQPAAPGRRLTPLWISLAVAAAVGVGWLALDRLPVATDAVTNAAGQVSIADRQLDENNDDPERYLLPEVAQRVSRLLETAQMHMAVQRLCEPVGSNARDAYTMVIQLDPQNKEASRALQRLDPQCEGR